MHVTRQHSAEQWREAPVWWKVIIFETPRSTDTRPKSCFKTVPKQWKVTVFGTLQSADIWSVSRWWNRSKNSEKWQFSGFLNPQIWSVRRKSLMKLQWACRKFVTGFRKLVQKNIPFWLLFFVISSPALQLCASFSTYKTKLVWTNTLLLTPSELGGKSIQSWKRGQIPLKSNEIPLYETQGFHWDLRLRTTLLS